MEIEIDPKKSIEKNAADYYEKSKKYKKKITGLKKAIGETKELIVKEQIVELKEQEKKREKKIVRKKEWFESFHWFFAKDHLVIGGRDARSNEVLVKKHMEKEDLFFHADVHGAPVVILKHGQKCAPDILQAVAVFAASFSRAWKAGRGTCDVYAVKPEQVKTAAKTGEHLPRGSFALEGKRTWFRNVELELAITYLNEKLMIGPRYVIEHEVPGFILVKPESRKTKGQSAKLVLKKLNELFPTAVIDINWVQEILPTGGSRIVS